MNSVLSRYLTRGVVDEIISPSFIRKCMENYSDDYVDADDTDGDEDIPPPPIDSPVANAKVLQSLQYMSHSVNSPSLHLTLYTKERNTHVSDVIAKTKVRNIDALSGLFHICAPPS